MIRYKNSVIPLVVAAGSSTNKATITTEPGFIKRVVIINKTPDNPGFVRAAIIDSGGEPIADLQPIEVFRTRDVAYGDDGLPLNIQGGRLITVQVVATENFDTDFPCDVVLIYEESND